MGEYRLSEQAAADLEDIFVYTIETFGEAQAERYKTKLEDAMSRIADDPRLGRAMEGRTRTFFQYNCESHGLFFVVEDDKSILIVRVLHLAMDLPRHLPG